MERGQTSGPWSITHLAAAARDRFVRRDRIEHEVGICARLREIAADLQRLSAEIRRVGVANCQGARMVSGLGLGYRDGSTHAWRWRRLARLQVKRHSTVLSDDLRGCQKMCT